MASETSPPAHASRHHLRLLKELSEAVAVSGDESAVRAIVRKRVEPHADEVRTDSMGNLLVVRRGRGRRRVRMMLAAHMDEVGLMVVSVTDQGGLKFERVGGLDPRQLLGKPVWIGKDRIPGVIGAKPVHLMDRDEEKQTVKIDAMTIDIGAQSKKEAEEKVKPGDRATFATPFRRHRSSICGKALDDRIGVATLIELVEHPPQGIDLLAAFTVQEEIGLRGARVAAYTLDPQAALALDCTPAYDLPTWDGEENLAYNARLRHGPAIYAADGRTIAHPGLLRHLIETARSEAIPYQIRQPAGGGTDAGAMQLARAGVPSISVSVPARYLHTAASIADLSDWRNTVKLVHAVLERMRPAILEHD